MQEPDRRQLAGADRIAFTDRFRALMPHVGRPIDRQVENRARESGQRARRRSGNDSEPELVARCVADIPSMAIEWIWEGVLARRKMTMIAGPPGLGKSTIGCAAAAVVSSAGRFPCENGNVEPGNVLILSAEDDAGDTVKPRLIAARADLARVHVVEATRSGYRSDGTPIFRPVDLDADLGRLRAYAGSIGGARLAIIDPISAYIGRRLDSHKASDVRELLAGVRQLAIDVDCAVLAIAHLNKSINSDAIGRVNASGAIRRGAARSLHGDARSARARSGADAAAEDQHRPRRPRFRLRNRAGPGVPRRRPRGAGEPGPVGNAARRDARGRGPRPRIREASDQRLDAPQLEQAVEFLRTVLAGGPRKSKEIHAEAREAGVARAPCGEREARCGSSSARSWARTGRGSGPYPEHLGDNVISLPVRGNPPDLRGDDDRAE